MCNICSIMREAQRADKVKNATNKPFDMQETVKGNTEPYRLTRH